MMKIRKCRKCENERLEKVFSCKKLKMVREYGEESAIIDNTDRKEGKREHRKKIDERIERKNAGKNKEQKTEHKQMKIEQKNKQKKDEKEYSKEIKTETNKKNKKILFIETRHDSITRTYTIL